MNPPATPPPAPPIPETWRASFPTLPDLELDNGPPTERSDAPDTVEQRPGRPPPR